MPHSRDKFVQDALLACTELKDFTSGKSLDDLESDRGLQLIIEREFEILGEALFRLRHHDEAAFSTITNGHRIIGTRNLLAHGYDIVEYLILWDAIHQDLPTLFEEIIPCLIPCHPRALAALREKTSPIRAIRS